MAHEEKPETGKVVVIPTIPLLPSGVYDMGTITRLISEAELANNPPASEESSSAVPKPEED